MHAHFAPVKVEELAEYGLARFYKNHISLLWLLLTVTAGLLVYAFVIDLKFGWTLFWVVTVYLMGLGLGGSIIPAILLIVKARWSSALNRIFDGFVRLAWISYGLFWISTLGAEVLFPWARDYLEYGRGFYMEPVFTYFRHGSLIFLYLVYITWFVRKQITLDLTYILSQKKFSEDFKDWEYLGLAVRNVDFNELNKKEYLRLCWHAPVLVFIYCLTVALFGFEFIMGMDSVWYSNLFGPHIFVSSIFTGWCLTALVAAYFKNFNKPLNPLLDKQVFWDLGKLCFGFSMLWAYFNFSQFLVQWYGNLPEETEWLAIRTRFEPWKSVMWIAFGCSFVIPFLTLLSQDVKKNYQLLIVPSFIALVGVYFERTLIIAPNLFHDHIPHKGIEILIFVAGLCFCISVAFLSFIYFFKKYPFFALSRHIFIDKIKKGEIDILEPETSRCGYG